MTRRALATGVFLVFVGGCSIFSSEHTPRQRFDDAGITTAVKSQLVDTHLSTLSDVDVETLCGIVYLTGTVSDEQAERRAVEIAREVDGVVKVVNDLDTE